MANLIQQYRETFPEFREAKDDQIVDTLWQRFGGADSGMDKTDFALELKGRGPRIGAFESGKQKLYGSLETGAAKALEGLGADEMSARLQERAAARREDVEERYQPRIRGYEDMQSIADIPEYAGQLIAGSAPQMGLQALGGIAALAATRGRARLPIVGPISKGTTATIGAGAAGFPAYFGSNIERQMEEGAAFEDTEAGPAALAALGQTALDAASLNVWFRGIPGVTAAEKAGRIGRAATRAVEAGATEALTETAQQSLEIMQADPEKFFSFSPAVKSELANAAIGGGLVGGLFGGAAGAVSRGPKTKGVEPPRPEGPQPGDEGAVEGEPLALPPPEGAPAEAPEGQVPEGQAPVSPGEEPLAPAPRVPPEEGITAPGIEPVAEPEIGQAPEPVTEPTAPVEPLAPVEPKAPAPKAPSIFENPNPPSLPKALQLGKWNYNYGNKGEFQLNFASDIEKALFQVTKKVKVPKDNEYRLWLKDQGLSDNEINGYGSQFRQILKEQVQARVKAGQNTGIIDVPRFTLKFTPQPVEPIAPAPAPVQPAPAPAPIQPAPAKPAPTAKPAPAPAPVKPAPVPKAPVQPTQVPFSKQTSIRSDTSVGSDRVLSTRAPNQQTSTINVSKQDLDSFNATLPGGIEMFREVAARLLPGVTVELTIRNDPNGSSYGSNTVISPYRTRIMLNPAAIALGTQANTEPRAREAFFTQVMFHELSHNVENFYLTTAPKSVVEAIIDQYVKQRNPGVMQRLAVADALKKLRPADDPVFFKRLLSRFGISETEYNTYVKSKGKVVPKRFKGKDILAPEADLRMDYYRSFSEWIAEKGAEWMAKEAQGIVPKTVFEKFQKDILKLLKDVYREVTKALGIKSREGAFEQFMRDNYGKRTSVVGTVDRVTDKDVIDYRNWGYTGQSQGTASTTAAEAPTSTASAAPTNVEAAQKKLAGAYIKPEAMGFKGFLRLVKEAYESGLTQNLGDKITRAATDRFIDLRRLDERFVAHLKATGRAVQAAYDQRYAIAANLSSYAGILARENVLGMLETTLKYGGVPVIKKFSKDPNDPLDGVLMISREGKQAGLTFLGDLVRADKLDAFKYYAMAQRVLGRYAGKQAPITQQEARDIVSFYEKDPEVVKAYKAYQDFNQALMQMAVDSGVISQKIAKEFMKHNDYYPFYREMDETGKYTGPLFTSGVLTSTKIQQATGGTGQLEADPIEVIMKNAQFWMHSAAKNLAARKIYTMLKEIGEADSIKNSNQLKPGEAEGVFRVNGLEQKFSIKNPDIAAALETTGAHQLPNWTKIPGKFTQFYRELVTRSPDFILKNIIRDPLNAFVTSGVSFNPFAAMDNFRKALTNPQMSAELRALQNYGIIGGFRSIPGTEDATQLLNTNFKPTSNGVYVVPNGNVLTGILSKAWNALGTASEASDAATRMEIYKKVLEATGNEAEAAFRAQEVINFRKQGASSAIRYLSILVPFINGRLQGMDVTARAFSTDLKKTLMKGGYLFAVSMAMQALMGDDEEYKQLPDYIRYGSMPVPLKLLGLGDSGFLAIPKPFEIGFVFQTVPEVLVQAAMGNVEQRELQKVAWEQLKNTFGLAMAPQFVMPIFEQLMNRSSLTGLPIVTEAQKNLPAELQYTSATSDIVKNLAGSMGISPVRAEALIKGYGGQIVTSMLGLIDGMYRSATGTGVDKDWTQYPTVSTFLKTQANTNPKGVADIYRLSAEIQGLTTAINTYVAQGMGERAVELVKENEGLLSMKQSISGLRTQLNTLSRNERMIVNNPNIPQDQKNEQLRQIRETRRVLGKIMSENISLTGK